MLTTEAMANKDITVQVRLTSDEHKRWLAVAEAEDRTLSNWIRRQCNLAAPGPAVGQTEVPDMAAPRTKTTKAKKEGR